jgi:hypothetical protein
MPMPSVVTYGVVHNAVYISSSFSASITVSSGVSMLIVVLGRRQGGTPTSVTFAGSSMTYVYGWGTDVRSGPQYWARLYPAAGTYTLTVNATNGEYSIWQIQLANANMFVGNGAAATFTQYHMYPSVSFSYPNVLVLASACNYFGAPDEQSGAVEPARFGYLCVAYKTSTTAGTLSFDFDVGTVDGYGSGSICTAITSIYGGSPSVVYAGI